ncbi:hypothetical protein VP01_3953g3 [Puccinia sorghi]|uniref:AB hydrolase-1 domain-containing protein n=1 Tax=Puccinia sorghi TaxID=27349 RepID=A0A0L6UT93_9BASI|nr:hypothetical protein VP01_3953g3 [Puccinia sorghi]
MFAHFFLLEESLRLSHAYTLVIVTAIVAVLTALVLSRVSLSWRNAIRLQLYSHHHSPVINTLSKESIRSVLINHCPSLLGPSANFSPTPWLFRPSTRLLATSQRSISLSMRGKCPSNYGGQIALDFTPPNRFTSKNDPTPVLVVLHGLTGGSHESYVRSVLSPLTKDYGWRAVTTNFRGCAGSELTSQKLYNAGATEDIRLIVQYLTTILSPLTPLHAIGFSLGANVLAKYLGEEADRAVIRSAVVVEPWPRTSG